MNQVAPPIQLKMYPIMTMHFSLFGGPKLTNDFLRELNWFWLIYRFMKLAHIVIEALESKISILFSMCFPFTL